MLYFQDGKLVTKNQATTIRKAETHLADKIIWAEQLLSEVLFFLRTDSELEVETRKCLAWNFLWCTKHTVNAWQGTAVWCAKRTQLSNVFFLISAKERAVLRMPIFRYITVCFSFYHDAANWEALFWAGEKIPCLPIIYKVDDKLKKKGWVLMFLPCAAQCHTQRQWGQMEMQETAPKHKENIWLFCLWGLHFWRHSKSYGHDPEQPAQGEHALSKGLGWVLFRVLFPWRQPYCLYVQIKCVENVKDLQKANRSNSRKSKALGWAVLHPISIIDLKSLICCIICFLT